MSCATSCMLTVSWQADVIIPPASTKFWGHLGARPSADISVRPLRRADLGAQAIFI